MAKKGQQEIVLQIRCKREDTKIVFKILAARLVENYEDTLLRLLELEKEHPLQKRIRGITERV